MYQFSATRSRVKKLARSLSKEQKIPLSKAQNLISLRLTNKTFHELSLHANGEKRRNLENRRELLQEIITFLKREFPYRLYENGNREEIIYRKGSPVAKLGDIEDISISAYLNGQTHLFSINIFTSLASDEWMPAIPKCFIKRVHAQHRDSFGDTGEYVAIIPSYRFPVLGKPLWKWIIQAAIANSKAQFSQKMDSNNFYGEIYAQGITKTYDKPNHVEWAITLDGLVSVKNNEFVGSIPQVSIQRSDGHGYFLDALAWAEDDQGRIFTSSSRMFDDIGTFSEILQAIAFIQLRQSRNSGKFISKEMLEKKQAAFWRFEAKT